MKNTFYENRRYIYKQHTHHKAQPIACKASRQKPLPVQKRSPPAPGRRGERVGAPNRKRQSRVGPHSSPDKLEKAARNCRQNTAAAQSNMEHGSPPAFQIPRRDGDEDEKGAVALEDNLRWTPGGVWVQEAVHRLEPGGGGHRGRVRAVAAEAEADNRETSSPRWILLHGKGPFQIDDVALVLKHPITEGDLGGGSNRRMSTRNTLVLCRGGGGGEPRTCLCISERDTCCRFSRWEWNRLLRVRGTPRTHSMM